MRLHTAFLADHAEALPGGLFVAGAYPEFVKLPTVPARARVVAVVVVELERSEIASEFVLGAELRRVRDGALLVGGEVPLRRVVCGDHFVADTPLYVRRVIELHVDFDDVGPHEVLLSMGGRRLADIRFGVCLDPAVEPDCTAA